ncbi:MAG: carbonic anhydrase [Chloroflexi bacterium]|nr:carbonic anhydrase [Chloroflexota bacterium]
MVTATEALQQLLDGNNRFALSRAAHPRQSGVDRIRIARDPQPFAAILACADSRVPPELVFDQGLGDLFVVRVAGNVVDDVVLGSLEYAVERFGIPLVVVLGHQECAAVESTIQAERVGHIGNLVDAIRPAVEQARRQTGDLLENAITTNIQMGVQQLRKAQPLLARMSDAGTLRIVGARYALYTGLVEVV